MLHPVPPDGSRIDGVTTFTRTNGATAATVSLDYEARDYALAQTVAHNGDGSTTIDRVARHHNGSKSTVVSNLHPDGSLANRSIAASSADGLTQTTEVITLATTPRCTRAIISSLSLAV